MALLKVDSQGPPLALNRPRLWILLRSMMILLYLVTWRSIAGYYSVIIPAIEYEYDCLWIFWLRLIIWAVLLFYLRIRRRGLLTTRQFQWQVKMWLSIVGIILKYEVQKEGYSTRRRTEKHNSTTIDTHLPHILTNVLLYFVTFFTLDRLKQGKHLTPSKLNSRIELDNCIQKLYRLTR